jgi:chromosomal replication initiation ATPase DnaA
MTQDNQLPLPFTHQPGYNPADFVPDASNAEALAWLDRTRDWPDRRLLLWGEAGCGKTHLLHIWTAATGATLIPGPYLCNRPLRLPRAGLAIDDADRAPEETELLHLLNLAREQAIPVLLAGHDPPSRWPTRLADLASRLRAITAVRIGPAEPELLRRLLMRLLADRQLTLPRGMQSRLLLNLPRTPAALRNAVAHLDHVAWHSGGRIPQSAVTDLFAAGQTEDNSATVRVPSSSAE